MKPRKQVKPKAGSDFERFVKSLGVHNPPDTGTRPLNKREFRRIENSPELLKTHYNAFASNYARSLYSRFLRVEEHELKIISSKVEFRPDERIVSVGSGPAIKDAFIAKQLVKDGRITCIDFAHNMGREAKKTAEKAGVANLSVVTGDASKLPLASGSQDKVMALQTNIPNTVSWVPFLKEARRVLKKTPNSRLVLTFISDNKAETRRALDVLKASGFIAVDAIKYAQAGSQEAVLLVAKPRLAAYY